MGLELYRRSGSDFPSDLQDPLEYRYLPGRAGAEGLNPHAKHHRRPLSWTQWKLSCAQQYGEEALVEEHGPLSGSEPENTPSYMQHLVNLAKTNLRYHRQYDQYHCSFPCGECCNQTAGRTKVTKGGRRACLNTVDEGQALAWSDIVLPGDDSRGNPLDIARGRGRSTPRSRSSSPPSLGRQDAFRDSRTTKKRSHRTMSTAASAALSRVVTEAEAHKVTSSAEGEVEDLYHLGILHHNDDDEVEQLYRMGLLYDDPHERGLGFTFDTIDHNEPLYKLNVRPTKRVRKSKVGGHPSKTPTSSVPRHTEEEAMQLELALNLSLAAFGEDEDLAACLMSPSQSEILTLVDVDEEEDPSSTESGSKRRRIESLERNERPLTVIYELEDADYSQDETGESHEISHGFNNHGDEEVEDEPWAFVEGSNDGDEDFICMECDAAAISPISVNDPTSLSRYTMAEDDNTTLDQDAWIHIRYGTTGDRIGRERETCDNDGAEIQPGS